MKIGDKEHFICPDPWAAKQAKRRRGSLQRAAVSTKTNSMISAAKKILKGQAESKERRADAVEQAMTYLRQDRFNVYRASVKKGPLNHFYIGNLLVDEAALLEFARIRREREK